MEKIERTEIVNLLKRTDYGVKVNVKGWVRTRRGKVFKEKIPELMSVDNVNIISEAKLSDNPIPLKPNKMQNIAIAAVFGLMLGVGLAFLFEFLDTTIKSEKDIEDVLGLPVVGVVRLIAEEKVKKTSLISRKVRRSNNVWTEK